MKCSFFILFIISAIGVSGISTPSIHQDEFTVSQMDAVLGSEYKLITEIEAYGVDVSNINKDFNDLLSMFSEAKLPDPSTEFAFIDWVPNQNK